MSTSRRIVLSATSAWVGWRTRCFVRADCLVHVRHQRVHGQVVPRRPRCVHPAWRFRRCGPSSIVACWPGPSFVAGAPVWADAGVLLPWLMYERYGDEDVLEAMFPAMRAWLGRVHEQNPDGIWRAGRGNDYGDWVPAGPDTSTTYFQRAGCTARLSSGARSPSCLGDAQATGWLRSEPSWSNRPSSNTTLIREREGESRTRPRLAPLGPAQFRPGGGGRDANRLRNAACPRAR